MGNDTFRAWAIDTCSPEGHGFIGRYYFGGSIPGHMGGCRLALFDYRGIGEAGLAFVRMTFPQAQVVRVEVKVTKV